MKKIEGFYCNEKKRIGFEELCSKYLTLFSLKLRLMTTNSVKNLN